MVQGWRSKSRIILNVGFRVYKWSEVPKNCVQGFPFYVDDVQPKHALKGVVFGRLHMPQALTRKWKCKISNHVSFHFLWKPSLVGKCQKLAIFSTFKSQIPNICCKKCSPVVRELNYYEGGFMFKSRWVQYLIRLLRAM